ncbi:MAG: N-acetylmuramidase domain-containing protein [Pseudomonadota bacterium]
MFDKDTVAAVEDTAKWLGVPLAALLAVAEVESSGRVGVVIKGRLEPLIRFEGHYFHRLLAGDERARAVTAGLASPKPRRVRNPRRQIDRWKLLDKAIAINREAALSSCSWGIGQVMGSHWRRLGYDSVDAMVETARAGAAGQVQLMARYIAHAKLENALRLQDWATFARRYNGPAYAQNRYDVKMAQAYDRWVEALSEPVLPRSTEAEVNATEGSLMFGARGEDVKGLQRALSRAGYVLVVDGLFGLVTDRVVRQFQRDHLLVVNGIAGQAERDLLSMVPNSPGRAFRLLNAGLPEFLRSASLKQRFAQPGAQARALLDCISRRIA